jgi:uncharacterized RDD family membrane protein YckC
VDPGRGFAIPDFWVRPGLPASALDGVRTRRIIAFCIDASAIGLLFLVFFFFFGFLGLLTFGLGWIVLPTLFPAVAILYDGTSISSWRMATFGMRMTDLEMRLVGGTRTPFLNAAAHVVFFYLSWTLLTPFVLLFSLFSRDKRCLHDLLAGVVVTRRL